MYHLTLSKEERKAFDFNGDRYNSGTVQRILWQAYEGDTEWDSPEPITFNLPEHKAWEIRELAEEEDNLWPNFAPELKDKLNAFCDSVV